MGEEESEQTPFPSTAMFVRESTESGRAIVQLYYYPAREKESCQKADFSNESPATWLWLRCHYPGGSHTHRNLTPIMIIRPYSVKDKPCSRVACFWVRLGLGWVRLSRGTSGLGGSCNTTNLQRQPRGLNKVGVDDLDGRDGFP